MSFQKKKKRKKRILFGRAVVKTHHGYSFAAELVECYVEFA